MREHTGNYCETRTMNFCKVQGCLCFLLQCHGLQTAENTIRTHGNRSFRTAVGHVMGLKTFSPSLPLGVFYPTRHIALKTSTGVPPDAGYKLCRSGVQF